MSTLVMKFGGAAVAAPELFPRIADIILANVKQNTRTVVVVSAMGGMTDQLIALAGKVNPQPPRREYDMLLSVGERISIALLAMALAAKKQEAVSFTGSQSGIVTTEEHAEARIIDVRPQRLLAPMEEGKVVIVAGFQGVSLKKEITTLGRGGSDTTAVALGVALKAEKVVFYKDVEGIYDYDPKHHATAKLLKHLSYDQAQKIVGQGAKVLHHRSVALAAQNGLPLQVVSFLNPHSEGSLVMDLGKSRPAQPLYE